MDARPLELQVEGSPLGESLPKSFGLEDLPEEALKSPMAKLAEEGITLDTSTPEANELADEEVEPYKPNRRAKRAQLREIKRMTRHPRACLQMYHPLLDTMLTPYGAATIAARRKKGKAAKQARKANR